MQEGLQTALLHTARENLGADRFFFVVDADDADHRPEALVMIEPHLRRHAIDHHRAIARDPARQSGSCETDA